VELSGIEPLTSCIACHGIKIARRNSRRTAEQFQRAAAKRQAGKAARENEAKTASEPVSELRNTTDQREKK